MLQVLRLSLDSQHVFHLSLGFSLQARLLLSRFLCQWHPTLLMFNLPWTQKAFRSLSMFLLHPSSCRCSQHGPLAFIASAYGDRASFFSQCIPSGHLPRYPKLLLLKSQSLLLIWAINTIQEPRFHWGQYLLSCSYMCQKWDPHQNQELHSLTSWRRGSYSMPYEI